MLREGSRVLASVSEYPYTRRAWRREGMELLLDPAFFSMDHEALRYVVVVVCVFVCKKKSL